MLYYGDKYRKMKVLENCLILLFFLPSDIRNLESKKQNVETENFFSSSDIRF